MYKMCFTTPTWIFMGQHVNNLHVADGFAHIYSWHFVSLSPLTCFHPQYVVFDFSSVFHSCCFQLAEPKRSWLLRSSIRLMKWIWITCRIFFWSRRMWQPEKNMIWFMFLDCCGFHSTFIQSPTVPEQIFGYFILCSYYIQNLHSNF